MFSQLTVANGYGFHVQLGKERGDGVTMGKWGWPAVYSPRQAVQKVISFSFIATELNILSFKQKHFHLQEKT